MKKTRFAIVGCGDIAREIGLISRFNRKIQIVACVDRNQKKAEQFARKNKVPKVFTGYEGMLAECELDFVYLAIPHFLHYPMILKALEKNRHVFCEKPVTVNLQEALEVCDRVKQQDCKIGVNYQYRYDKACYAIAKAAHKGELGEIHYIRCNVPWLRNESYFTDSSWHASKQRSGGGTLITQASHLVDIALWIAGSYPEAVSGMCDNKKFKEIEVEDMFMGSIQMESGCQIQICSSMVAFPERYATIEVYGSKGTALYEARFFPKARFLGCQVKKEKPPVGGLHALVASLEGYRRWVSDGSDYQMPIQKSIKVLATVEALYKAAESGQTTLVDNSYRKFLEGIG